MRLLTVNAGSSSLKLSLLEDEQLLDSWTALPVSLPRVDAVAHRVVHGGAQFHGPVLIDDVVIAQLHGLRELAPLHQDASLAAVAALRAALPDVPHVACFDTAFHTTIPDEAARFALPREWVERYGLRRFGFHGLSHAWVARRAAELVPTARRVISCHLGAGASVCAIAGGRSVDTTMGFTPLDGLVMATRSGSVDPGLVLWLVEREAGVEGALEHRSGLLALTGTADMAEVLGRTDAEAVGGLAVYVHRLRAAIAGMAAALGGVDLLVFTGGVGEHAPAVRAAAAEGLGFLGIALDPHLNEATTDQEVSAAGSAVRTLVVSCREDLEMSRQARLLLGA